MSMTEIFKLKSFRCREQRPNINDGSYKIFSVFPSFLPFLQHHDWLKLKAKPLQQIVTVMAVENV